MSRFGGRGLGLLVSLLAEGLRGAFGRGRDDDSWSAPTNDEVVPRELRWTVREEPTYGGERHRISGLDEENRRARMRLAEDLSNVVDPSSADDRQANPDR